MCSPTTSNSVPWMQQTPSGTRRNEVRRWGIHHVVPTIPLAQRQEVADTMVGYARNATWASWLFGVLIEGLLASLPDDDLWRHASFTIDMGEGQLLRSGALSPPAVGAVVGPGIPLGSVDAFFDVDEPVFENLEIDPVFAPIFAGISDTSAALVGAGGAGVKVITSAIASIPDDGRFVAADDAIRWLLHRRSLYGDVDDMAAWFAEQVWSAEWRASTIEAGDTTGSM